VKEANRLCNERELIEGTQIDRSFPSPDFINSPIHAALVAFANQRRAPEEAPVPLR